MCLGLCVCVCVSLDLCKMKGKNTYVTQNVTVMQKDEVKKGQKKSLHHFPPLRKEVLNL